jgi:hypothetical protein
MGVPRTLFEVVAEACHESERNVRKDVRTTLTFRIQIAGWIDQIPKFAESALHGRFMTLLRIRSIDRLRKASSRENEGWVEIEQVSVD